MKGNIALIPARAGSKRVVDKNIRLLGGHPLIAYTIAAARQSEVFSSVVVSTDSPKYAEIAKHYGAEVPFLRPAEFAGDDSPDFEWIEYTLTHLSPNARYEYFTILRPTSPFRMPETIQRAFSAILMEQGVDSLRAVEKCAQHPGKMWVVRGKRMTPLLPFWGPEQPWHSSQYPALPEIHVQNASLEIAKTRVIFETKTITGHVVMPFLTEGYEGMDVNSPEDWWYVCHLLERGEVQLPTVTQSPFIF